VADWKVTAVEYAKYIPFMMVRRTDAGDLIPGARLNGARVIESLIIAGVTGLIVMYGAQQRQDAMMQRLESLVAEQARVTTAIELRQDNDRREGLARNDRIEGKLDAHIAGAYRRGGP